MTGKPGDIIQAAKALIIKGIECGFLTEDELRAGFPDIELDPAELLLVAARFQQMGIRVFRDAEDELPEPEAGDLAAVALIPYAAGVKELELDDAVESGNTVARDELIEAHLHLVQWMAMRHMRSGISWSELMEAGNRGLVQAVEKSDYRKGFRLSNYAAWWVRRAMLRAIAKQPPNPDYIPGTMLLTTIGDAVDGLTPRQRRILQLRFGLIDGHARTRDKVGKLFGITAERVGEIELQALRKLPLLPTAGPGTRPDPR